MCEGVTDTFTIVLRLLLLDVWQKESMTLMWIETGLSFSGYNQMKDFTVHLLFMLFVKLVC